MLYEVITNWFLTSKGNIANSKGKMNRLELAWVWPRTGSRPGRYHGWNIISFWTEQPISRSGRHYQKMSKQLGLTKIMYLVYSNMKVHLHVRKVTPANVPRLRKQAGLHVARITSYNVCYTKLLREIESAHKSIPQKRLKLPGASWLTQVFDCKL